MTTQEILKNVNHCLETGFTMYLSTKEDVQTVFTKRLKMFVRFMGLVKLLCVITTKYVHKNRVNCQTANTY